MDNLHRIDRIHLKSKLMEIDKLLSLLRIYDLRCEQGKLRDLLVYKNLVNELREINDIVFETDQIKIDNPAKVLDH